MKNNLTFFVLILSTIMILNSTMSSGQTVTVGNATANPGEDILVPINFNSLNNIGAITLFILYDASVLTFNGVTNIVAEGAGTLANGMTNPTRVGIAWSASTGGVNFPDGKYLDLQFTFIGGSTALDFSNACEIVDWDANPLTVTYVDGDVSAPALTFNLTVFLEGAYQSGSGTMKTDLLTAGVLPTSQPYGPSLPYYNNPNPAWYYQGTENISSIPPNAVDWILIELRDAATAAQATSASVVARKACWLMNNGSIRELDGTTAPSFLTSFSQGAFVVIWHRNHLGIMTSNPVPGFSGSYIYNFSTGAGQVNGGSAGYKQLGTNVWGMAAGDINGDKTINSIDKSSGWNVDAGKKGFKGSDANLNDNVTNQDKNDFILSNNGKASGVPN